jgi:hypothetical protein
LQKAVEYDNLFHYLSYEGGVDLDTIPEDEILVNVSQMLHFGQVPSKLFDKEHGALIGKPYYRLEKFKPKNHFLVWEGD